MKIDENDNLYELLDNHFISKLIFIYKIANEYIFRSNVFDVVKKL